MVAAQRDLPQRQVPQNCESHDDGSGDEEHLDAVGQCESYIVKELLQQLWPALASGASGVISFVSIRPQFA